MGLFGSKSSKNTFARLSDMSRAGTLPGQPNYSGGSSTTSGGSGQTSSSTSPPQSITFSGSLPSGNYADGSTATRSGDGRVFRRINGQWVIQPVGTQAPPPNPTAGPTPQAGQAGQDEDQVELPQMPEEVWTSYDYEIPSAVNDIEATYANVPGMQNIGDQLASNYDDIQYVENDEEINRLYDDMMSLLNWDEAKQEVLREGAIGSRAAMSANVGGLGGSFISAMSQADINTQGALMAKKQDFINKLIDIQRSRADALTVEHHLGQEYGIQNDITQAGLRSEEDRAVRDAAYNLDLHTADVVAGELSKENTDESARRGARAAARSGAALTEWEEQYGTAEEASNAEQNLEDISSSAGVPMQVDPQTGEGRILGTDKTVSAAAVTVIKQSDLQMKMDEGVVDIRSDLSNWCADNPNATRQEILNQAGQLMFQGLIALMGGWDKNKTSQEIRAWAEEHMRNAYGGDWRTNFTGIMRDPGTYRPTGSQTSQQIT